jgi:hypothetical protein
MSPAATRRDRTLAGRSAGSMLAATRMAGSGCLKRGQLEGPRDCSAAFRTPEMCRFWLVLVAICSTSLDHRATTPIGWFQDYFRVDPGGERYASRTLGAGLCRLGMRIRSRFGWIVSGLGHWWTALVWCAFTGRRSASDARARRGPSGSGETCSSCATWARQTSDSVGRHAAGTGDYVARRDDFDECVVAGAGGVEQGRRGNGSRWSSRGPVGWRGVVDARAR